MDLHKKIQEMNQRWNISDEEPVEEKFKKFKIRILNIFPRIDTHLSEETVALFCNIMGIEEKWKTDMYSHRRWGNNVINEITRESNPKKFYKLLNVILDLDIIPSGSAHKIDFSKEILIERVQEAIKFSDINIVLKEDKNGVTVYPSGEKFLDENLINPILSFLSEKPNKHFIDALKFYEEDTPESRVKSANSLRRALEEFLMEKMSNDAGLKANISHLASRLISLNANEDIKSLVDTALTKLDRPIFNKNTKHADGKISKSESEYLIYQVAILMRYIAEILPN